ncbi:MAG: hypothetical protein Q7J06_10990 [Bacteroidales bacterium]|nr:hypothetical protein [Bacteroidales bacterium]
MKVPKTMKRYCLKCKKHTTQKVVIVSSGHQRGSLKRGSIARAKLRGRGKGKGNLGKWGSKKAASKFKMKVKNTKKTNLMYTCQTCKKSKNQLKGRRVKKIVYKEEDK